jgi:hypothetical protein
MKATGSIGFGTSRSVLESLGNVVLPQVDALAERAAPWPRVDPADHIGSVHLIVSYSDNVSSWTDAFGRWNGGCTHAATNIKNGHTGNERKTIHSPPDAELDRIRTGFGLAAGANLTITGVKPTDIPDPTEGGVLAISAGSARPVRASSTRRRNSRPIPGRATRPLRSISSRA